MNKDALLAATLLHIPSLRPWERIRLYQQVQKEDLDWERVGQRDVESLVGRPLAVPSWNMADWIHRGNQDLERALRRGIRWVLYGDPAYPPLLREISDPPLLLYMRGSLLDVERPCVAIVGTREPTPAGRKDAYRLGREFASAGLAVVSGLARGIDAMAHRGALDGKGITLAVLGSGLDGVYPVSNRPLAERIVHEGGTLISEYAPGVPPYKWHFPARNRIIAGLSRTIVISEAPEHSGALITAQFGLDMGRDVWVSSINKESPRGKGACQLVEQGAPWIHTAEDVLHDWQMVP
ncbi:MAG TPA: DNA-processing protein DprA [Termitinemataceae bacterium]|uniref:DNA-processing protein DprA n=1 Tax=Treponema sp. J25 TaxID=2094121 RepID=UPI0010466D02|nr:DNA-processing protein DprA [Treponema sp. J25]TCW62612.1 DNA-protecting protein DprA [Treponema sp. J25]HOJ98297.1 DNA-processing protein DprA [Termitinemataceae bacterium]HOM22661.1 DNA-processing protein DprA [Termitinemataceae bacterium]HPP99500.1 DNA-processing protein DprA [Termitinemataceae bacterium]